MAFYIQNVKGSYWTPYDIGGEIGIAIAVVWNARVPVAPSIWHDNVVILLQRPR